MHASDSYWYCLVLLFPLFLSDHAFIALNTLEGSTHMGKIPPPPPPARGGSPTEKYVALDKGHGPYHREKHTEPPTRGIEL